MFLMYTKIHKHKIDTITFIIQGISYCGSQKMNYENHQKEMKQKSIKKS